MATVNCHFLIYNLGKANVLLGVEIAEVRHRRSSVWERLGAVTDTQWIMFCHSVRNRQTSSISNFFKSTLFGICDRVLRRILQYFLFYSSSLDNWWDGCCGTKQLSFGESKSLVLACMRQRLAVLSIRAFIKFARGRDKLDEFGARWVNVTTNEIYHVQWSMLLPKTFPNVLFSDVALNKISKHLLEAFLVCFCSLAAPAVRMSEGAFLIARCVVLWVRHAFTHLSLVKVSNSAAWWMKNNTWPYPYCSFGWRCSEFERPTQNPATKRLECLMQFLNWNLLGFINLSDISEFVRGVEGLLIARNAFQVANRRDERGNRLRSAHVWHYPESLNNWLLVEVFDYGFAIEGVFGSRGCRHASGVSRSGARWGAVGCKVRL